MNRKYFPLLLCLPLLFSFFRFFSPPPIFARALVQTSRQQIPLDFITYNQCTSEFMHLFGTIRYTATLTVTDKGWHVIYEYDPQPVQGVGLSSGVSYLGIGKTSGSYTVTGNTIQTTDNNTFGIVRQGQVSGNNLIDHYIVHQTFVGGELTASQFNFSTTECRGLK